MISTEKYKAIAELDFSAIKMKLMHATFGEGWSQSKADAMETEYKRFLYLQSAYPDEQTAPTLDVDTFWHYHILDTMKYAADCEQAFGYFLHHYPYLGLMEDDAPDVEVEAGKRMAELYEAEFGEAYIRPEAYGQAASDSARCQGMCMSVSGEPAGHEQARCQGMCMAVKASAKGHENARCQGMCMAVKANAKGHESARCQGMCMAVKAKAQGQEQARCQGMCMAKPASSRVSGAASLAPVIPPRPDKAGQRAAAMHAA